MRIAAVPIFTMAALFALSLQPAAAACRESVGKIESAFEDPVFVFDAKGMPTDPRPRDQIVDASAMRCDDSSLYYLDKLDIFVDPMDVEVTNTAQTKSKCKSLALGLQPDTVIAGTMGYGDC